MFGYMCLFWYMGKPSHQTVRRVNPKPNLRRSCMDLSSLPFGVLLSLHLLMFENIGIHVPMCASAFCRLAQRVCQGPIKLCVPLLHRVTWVENLDVEGRISPEWDLGMLAVELRDFPAGIPGVGWMAGSFSGFATKLGQTSIRWLVPARHFSIQRK